jgi:hypothetical protein
MISGARPGSIPDAQREPSPELEVLFRHEPLALGGYGLCQVPEQKLLSDRGGGKPDSRLHRGIEIGKLGPKSRFPDVLMHSDLLALPLRPEQARPWLPFHSYSNALRWRFPQEPRDQGPAGLPHLVTAR